MTKFAAAVGFSTALIIGAALPLGGAQALTFTNGSFETGTDPGSFLTLNSGNSSDIPGWTVSSGSIDYIGSYWTSADGKRSLDLNGLVPGGVSQTISGLTPNAFYKVSFDLAGNPAGGPALKTLGVVVGIGSAVPFAFNAASTNLTNMGWTLESFTFQALSTSELLTFTSTTTANSGNGTFPTAFGPALDNVSVSATPLPSTWSMLIAGFVGLGLIAYRGTRKNRTATATA
jgi:choice-of-anchor C domain-containing protein